MYNRAENDKMNQLLDVAVLQQQVVMKEKIDSIADQNSELYSEMKMMKDLLKDLSSSVKCSNDSINSNNVERLTDKDIKIEELNKEMAILKAKINLPIPFVTITYIIGSSMLFSLFLTILLVMIIKKVFIIHPFICITSIIGSLGLIITAVASIKDWREYIKHEQY